MKKVTLVSIISICLFIIAANSFVYLTTKPGFCNICHKAEHRTLGKSTHTNLTCSDCHQSKGILAFSIRRVRIFQMLAAGLTGLYRKPVTADIPNENCNYCHNDVRRQTLSKSSIRVSHLEILQAGWKCTQCHNTVAHGKAVPDKKAAWMETCLQCHNNEGAPAECETCHVKGADWQKRLVAGPWQHTHGPKWRKLHGMGDLKICSACHDKGTCTRCHQIDLPHPLGFMNIHGDQSKESPDSCSVCHRKSFCSDCHKITMPHPNDFLAKHNQEYERSGQKVCLNCHTLATCDFCHEMHVHPGLSPGDIVKLREE